MNIHDSVVQLAKECGLDDHEGRVNNRVGMALEKFIKLTSRDQYTYQVAGIAEERDALRAQVATLTAENEALVRKAADEEREACAKIAKLHISSALRIDNSDDLDNAGDIGECYANSTAEDIETAIRARRTK